MNSIVFIYNPKAGNSKNRSIEQSILALLPREIKSIFLHIDQLDQLEESNPYQVYVAIGGDGTVNSVAELCLKHNKILAIIPRGSGDGLARHRNLPYPLKEALNVILKGQSIQIDTASANEHFFLNVAGIGFEAKVAHYFSTMTKRGLVGYVKAIIKLFYSYAPLKAEISTEGQKSSKDFFSLSLANGSQWGNNFEVASDASMRDGMLDIAFMQKPKWYQLPRLIAYLRSKNQNARGLFSYQKSASSLIESKSTEWHLDGEPVHINSPVQIKVKPASLTILVPA